MPLSKAFTGQDCGICTRYSHIKKQRHYFANKGLSNQSYGFSSSHAWMWELDDKESWVPKNKCFWIVVLETLESPLDCKEIQPVNPKGNQHWILIGRTDAETETNNWPPHAKNWLIGKDPDAGKDWRWEEKGMTGWDGWMASPTWWTWVWASSRSWWWTGKPGVLSPWACKKSDTTEWLNWTTLFVCPYQGQATLWRVMWSRSGETMAPQGNKECDVVPAKHGGWGTGKKKKKVTSPFSKSKWGMCAREALRKTERGERVRGTGSAQWTLVADMRSFCGSGALPATLHSGMVCSIISKNFT